jgi:hypothetical protein
MERNEKGEGGLALGAQTQLSLIDLIGMSFIPLYLVVGPFMFFLSLLLGVGWPEACIDDLPEGGHHCEVQRAWSV